MSEYKDTAVFTMAALASSTILQPHDFEPATAKRHSEVENCGELHAWSAEVFDKGSSHICRRIVSYKASIFSREIHTQVVNGKMGPVDFCPPFNLFES